MNPYQQLLDAIDAVKALVGDFAAQMETARTEGYAAGKTDGYTEGYAKGLEDGKAANPSDKIYSQAELDKAISDAVTPLNEKIAALQIVVDGIDATIDEKVKAIKAEVMEKFLAQQNSETASETEFLDYLRS